MNFCTYIEHYKKHLTDAETNEEILAEAKINYRIQKLLIPYIMKDKQTFNYFKRLAVNDVFAEKLVKHAQATVSKLYFGEVYSSKKMKDLMFELNSTTNSLEKIPRNDHPEIQEWEFIGYAKMFNNYLVDEKLNNLDTSMKQKIDNMISKIDWNNLISANA